MAWGFRKRKKLLPGRAAQLLEARRGRERRPARLNGQPECPRAKAGVARLERMVLAEEGVDEIVCAECGREPREGENPHDEWRVYSDGVGELLVFCPECAAQEFG
jgi:hypothetical protein